MRGSILAVHALVDNYFLAFSFESTKQPKKSTSCHWIFHSSVEVKDDSATWGQVFTASL